MRNAVEQYTHLCSIGDTAATQDYYNACVALMDDELRDKISYLEAPCSDDMFLGIYCREHAEKFSEEFIVN